MRSVSLGTQTSEVNRGNSLGSSSHSKTGWAGFQAVPRPICVLGRSSACSKCCRLCLRFISRMESRYTDMRTYTHTIPRSHALTHTHTRKHTRKHMQTHARARSLLMMIRVTQRLLTFFFVEALLVELETIIMTGKSGSVCVRFWFFPFKFQYWHTLCSSDTRALV